MNDTLTRFREERLKFPITRRYAYLNHAGRGPLSPPAHAVMGRITEEMLYVHPDQLPGMIEDLRRTRSAIAELIGAPSTSIGLVPNTSSGIAMAAGSLPIQSGDNVICARGEFPANVYPWLNLTRRGVEVRFLESRPGGVTVDQVREAVDGRTRVVALSWVGFSDGTRIDTAAVGALCAERGIFFVVDAIQGVGALRVDLEGMDILVSGGGKWTLAPQGSGFVYIRPSLVEKLHPDRVGWLSIAGLAELDDLNALTAYRFELVGDARRVETGSNSLLTQTALGESCRYLKELGPAAVEERIIALADYLIEGLRRKGRPIVTPLVEGRRSGIVCFGVEDAVNLAERLIERDVIVSAREGNVRAGIHFYNDEDDVDRLLAEL
ncbi:MAG TPA: aminotransferase class V-fold PLP-dependent enzyme [bacterium]|nr:aminotransferase class V-fold PLP-dependent enzyme [bacterium]